ncbi:glutamate ABC transporter substrate-binding protein [Nocardia brasiliensis]|uniref:glutamate ABC transporter substrate-binding protein n=1 Tax=Nocardia brasiliensis TaxID=37326 RepID=UPI00245541B0|nr:glutamate ABC transporter substrate-binding protein [Nocardia brasiliensis]
MNINPTTLPCVWILALPLTITLVAGCTGEHSRPGALGHAATGKLTIGIKFDQPGLSMRDTDGSVSGFDVEIAEHVAGRLGVQTDGITFKESPTAQRETMVENGQVDFIVAGYTITDQRKSRVGFAGPYYLAGQSLMVRADNTDITGSDNLRNKKVCTLKGTTSAQNIDQNFPDTHLHTFDTYSMCLEGLRSGSWDAMTADDIILVGYAAQNAGDFKIVGRPFTTESYGIGVKKDDRELRAKINDAIEAMIADGSWEKAFTSTVGASGYPISRPPNVNRY